MAAEQHRIPPTSLHSALRAPLPLPGVEDNRWGASRSNGHTRSNVVLPTIPLQPCLSARGTQRESAYPTFANYPAAPHSARETPASQRQQGGRAGCPPCVEHRPAPQRGAPGAGNLPQTGAPGPRRASSGPPATSEERFLAVVTGAGPRPLDAKVLGRLESVAGPAPQHQEVVRVLQALLRRWREVEPPSTATSQGTNQSWADVNQMVAQVAYLEKKVGRLKERLKRPERGSGGEENTSPQRQNYADSVRDKEKELSLKKTLALLHSQIQQLRVEKENAEANADDARGLVEQVEVRLREAVMACETERIKLEAEQEILRRQIAERQQRLQESEGLTFDAKELELMKATLAKAEFELVTHGLFLSEARKKAPLEAEEEEHEEIPTRPPVEDTKLAEALAAGPSEQEEYEQLVQAREEIEQKLNDVVTELVAAREECEAQVNELEAKLKMQRSEAQEKERQRRKELADSFERRFEELTETAKNLQDMKNKENEAAQDAKDQHEKLMKELEEELASEQAAVSARVEALERHQKLEEEELQRAQQHAQASQKRQSSLRRCYLAMRPAKYDRKETLHFLGTAMCVPPGALVVLEESILDQDTECADFVKSSGELLPPPEDKTEVFVRPLPEPTASRPTSEGKGMPFQSSALDASHEEIGQAVAQNDTRAAPTATADSPAIIAAAAPDGSLIRVMFEFADARHASMALDKLVDLIRTGGSLLDDLAIVGICVLRGNATFVAKGEPDSAVKLLMRTNRPVSGRQLIITAYGSAMPLSVKLVAVDRKSNEDFLVGLSQSDLQNLFGTDAAMCMGAPGDELLRALLPLLHFVHTHPDGVPVLVAVQSVAAPVTELNVHPAHRDSFRERYGLQALAKKAFEEDTAEEIAPAVQFEMFEEHLSFGGRKFNFRVTNQPDDNATGSLHLYLEEAEARRNFEAVMPAGRGYKSAKNEIKRVLLRAFAQVEYFGDVALMFAVEDVPQLSGLLLRLSACYVDDAAGVWNAPDQHVYWLPQDASSKAGKAHKVSKEQREELLTIVRAALESPDSLGAAVQAESQLAPVSSSPQVTYGGGGDVQDIQLSAETLEDIQLLPQDDAERYFGDERFCLLRAARKLGTSMVQVHIFEEPDAPNAAFVLNNLLVIAYDVTRDFYFSTRLQDHMLRSVLPPEEQHLIDPDHRLALLKRVFHSLDLAAHVGNRGALYEELAMQTFRTLDEEVQLQLDGAGILCNLAAIAIKDAEEEDDVSRDSDEAGEEEDGLGELRRDDEGESEDARTTASSYWDPRSAVGPLRTNRVVQIGGIQLGGFSDTPATAYPENKTNFATRQGRLGDVDLELCLRLDHHDHAHVLAVRPRESAAFDRSSTGAVEVRIPAGGDPTRVYLERRNVAGIPVIIAMAQQAFPHKVRGVVCDPRSQQELHIETGDNAIVAMTERSLRELLIESVEQLVKFGALASPEQYRLTEIGREVLPVDPVARALQQHIPVVAVNFSRSVHEVPSELMTVRALLFSCSRFVGPPARIDELVAAGASHDPASPSASGLESMPMIRLSLSKKSYCQDFTFSIEETMTGLTMANSDPASHMISIRDKLTSSPLGVYAEIQKVGSLRLLVIFMDDSAPRALRIAVVEPTTGWRFEMVVVDAGTPTLNAPLLVASPPRHELLQLFRQLHESHRRMSRQVQGQLQLGLASVPPTPRPGTSNTRPGTSPRPGTGRGATPATPRLGGATPVTPRRGETPVQFRRGASPASPHHHQRLASPRQDAVSPVSPLPEMPELPRALRTSILRRETRFAPSSSKDSVQSDDVVLITVSYEVADGEVQGEETEEARFVFRAVLSHPSSARESQVLLVNPGLDKLLTACSLPPAAGLDASLLDEEPARGKVSSLVFSSLEVLPSLELKFRLDWLAEAAADLLKAEEPTQRPAEDAAVSSVVLACEEDALLGRHDRGPVADGGPSLLVEVFDAWNCVQALFHRTNLRVRVTDSATKRMATRDLHEDDLEPWLGAANATHLLGASNEAELVELLGLYAGLSPPHSGPDAVVLEKLPADLALTA